MMKRILYIVAVLLLFGAAAWAQDTRRSTGA